MSAESKMLKARAQLIMENPFFGVLALKLKLIENAECKTAATDGTRLLYAPKFIDKLSNVEVKGLVAHEVMHCVWNHMTRRNQRDPKKWNIACDFAINPYLIQCGFVLPQGALVDPQFNDWSADAIYNKLPNEDTDQCAWGMVLDADAGSIQSGSNAALESDWQVATNQAISTAKQAGKMPGDLERALADIVKPIVPWKSILWPFCTSLNSDEYSWSKPNRAYISEDEYFPSMRSEGAGHFAIIVDSSGSTDEHYEQFMAEMKAIHSDLRPEKITIVHCDYIVQHTTAIDKYDEFPISKIYGGGGTRFSPAFDWLNENAPDVEAAVYLTDLECNDYGEQPHYPVLWVSTTSLEAPWGQTCRIAA